MFNTLTKALHEIVSILQVISSFFVFNKPLEIPSYIPLFSQCNEKVEKSREWLISFVTFEPIRGQTVWLKGVDHLYAGIQHWKQSLIRPRTILQFVQV